MKFSYCKDKDSKSWVSQRYGVHISRKPGPNQVLFIVYVTVADKKDGEYTPITPRFEVQEKTADDSVYTAGAIAEAIVREMHKLPEDCKLSKVKKTLKAISALLVKSGKAGGSSGRTKPQIILP